MEMNDALYRVIVMLVLFSIAGVLGVWLAIYLAVRSALKEKEIIDLAMLPTDKEGIPQLRLRILMLMSENETLRLESTELKDTIAALENTINSLRKEHSEEWLRQQLGMRQDPRVKP